MLVLILAALASAFVGFGGLVMEAWQRRPGTGRSALELHHSRDAFSGGKGPMIRLFVVVIGILLILIVRNPLNPFGAGT